MGVWSYGPVWTGLYLSQGLLMIYGMAFFNLSV